MKLNLFRKFLLALFLTALLPLVFSSATLFLNLKSTSAKLAARISDATDRQASENLQSRARQIAEDVAQFLGECENDLRLVAALPKDRGTLRTFYDSRNLEIWRRAGNAGITSEMSIWGLSPAQMLFLRCRPFSIFRGSCCHKKCAMCRGLWGERRPGEDRFRIPQGTGQRPRQSAVPCSEDFRRPGGRLHRISWRPALHWCFSD